MRTMRIMRSLFLGINHSNHNFADAVAVSAAAAAAAAAVSKLALLQ